MKEEKMTEEESGKLRAEKLAGGEITLAEYVGLSKPELYKIAQKGYQMVEMGRLDDAKTIFKGLVSADPFDSVFHCQLAGIYFKEKDLEKAFKEYDTSIRLNLANVDALSGRGELFLMQGKYEEGIQDLRQAIESDPQGKKQSSIRARGLLLSLRDSVQEGEKKAEAKSN